MSAYEIYYNETVKGSHPIRMTHVTMATVDGAKSGKEAAEAFIELCGVDAQISHTGNSNHFADGFYFRSRKVN